jgi:uncharacterized protein YndB with AHSA1/START domain
MAPPVSVTAERRIAAQPEAVFDAWLDPDGIGRWLFATPDGVMERIEVDPRIGGRFLVAERRGQDLAEHHGEYVALDRPSLIAFDFWTSFSEERTRVTVTIAADGDGALLTLRHDGVWADYEDRTQKGWAMILENLARSLA